MEIEHVQKLERAMKKGRLEQVRFGLGLLFVLSVMLYTASLNDGNVSMTMVIAAMVGAYMAMNVGANDVANNVGPAVGSKAMHLGTALVIAAIFEAAGAIIAGGEVVGTIRNGIIDPAMIPDTDAFVRLMLAALMAGALWLNIATATGAPVSTTHSIVGAVLGAGVAAAGMDIVNWGKMGSIAMSWIVSPLMGALVAALFLYIIKRSITYQNDMMTAARRVVPWLVAAMAWTFTTYLLLKGASKLITISLTEAASIGFAVAVVTLLILKWRLRNEQQDDRQGKSGVNSLFNVPLIFAAALLSFAHGSNDVANAIGPLAAIVDVYSSSAREIHSDAPIPLWVMLIGAIGIAVGLALYGPKVIRTIGSEITELDQMRAFCIAMAATLTVIIASQLGMPVSSTHIAVGGVFGVGFLREYLKHNFDRMVSDIKAHHPEGDQVAIDLFIAEFTAADIHQKGSMIRDLKARAKIDQDPAHFSKLERKGLRKVYRKELVKRSQLLRIAAAWVITVPATALMAAVIYFLITGIMT